MSIAMMCNTDEEHPRCTATCPSCKADGEFIYRGVQYWPDALVDEKRPPAQVMWECGNCHTAVLDESLIDKRSC